MTTLIAERPLIVAFMLGILAAAMIYGWLQTGRRPLAIAGLMVLALIPVSWIVAERWVTDREQIEQLIHDTAEAVQTNNHNTVLGVIGDDATRRQAAMELPRYEFSVAEVTSIREITVLTGTLPLEAEVDINVKVVVSDKRGSLKNIRVPRRVQLTMEKRYPAGVTDRGSSSAQPSGSDGSWVVTGYQHLPIIGKPDGFTTRPVP
ncbi:MAG: hypothetical protein AAF539_05685 [Planctomycetota bacterium]